MHKAETKEFTISIHAPTRGATTSIQTIGLRFPNFNPRSHEGSDPGTVLFLSPELEFQSTLPRGERHIIAINIILTGIFQSTLPRGERLLFRGNLFVCIEFQSTLPRGERRCSSSSIALANGISIHAPTRGATAIFAKKFSFLSAKIV